MFILKIGERAKKKSQTGIEKTAPTGQDKKR
jgi:hypothetical protein